MADNIQGVIRIEYTVYVHENDDREDLTVSLMDAFEDAMCPENCDETTCRLGGGSARFMTLEEWDAELDEAGV